MRKIGFISPYNKGCQMAERIAKKIGIEIICEVGVLDSAVAIAKRMFEENNVQAIIDRQPTASFLTQIWGSSIVELPISNFSLFKALLQCKQYSNDIAYLIGTGCEIQKNYIPELEKLLDIHITYFELQGNGDQPDVAMELKKAGFITAISAAGCMMRPCAELGIKLFMLELDEGSLMQAIKSAAAIADVKETTEQMRSYLNTDIAGILLCNGDSRIQVCNNTICQMSGLDESFLIGKTLQEVAALSPFFNVLVGSKDVFQYKNHFYNISISSMEHSQERNQIYRIIQYNPDAQKKASLSKSQKTSTFTAKYVFDDIIGEHPDMVAIKQEAKRFASVDSPILIIGESGVGKELFAQSIHNASRWADGPFVAVNCAALPENLLESELYGYTDGAFTGARKGGKEGMFELSQNGTLFLDEIGELPLSLQAKLLRSIQEKQIVRVGGTATIHINNRIICASNRNLIEEIQNRTFRADLFYRINVLNLMIPPLRQRKSDIALLAVKLSQAYRTLDNKLPVLSTAILETLNEYDWPGNVRQLNNFLESMIVISPDSEIDYTHFQKYFQRFIMVHSLVPPTYTNNIVDTTGKSLEELEEEIIHIKYEQFDHNSQATANALGISRATLWRKLNAKQEEK